MRQNGTGTKMQQPNQIETLEPQRHQQQNPNSLILKEKLKQLETEIEKFQEKNAEIDKLRDKLNNELVNESAQKRLVKQREEELNKMREMHEEEVRKFRVEKKVFEQFRSSLKEGSHFNKKEREEIESLKKQVQNEVYFGAKRLSIFVYFLFSIEKDLRNAGGV